MNRNIENVLYYVVAASYGFNWQFIWLRSIGNYLFFNVHPESRGIAIGQAIGAVIAMVLALLIIKKVKYVEYLQLPLSIWFTYLAFYKAYPWQMGTVLIKYVNVIALICLIAILVNNLILRIGKNRARELGS